MLYYWFGGTSDNVKLLVNHLYVHMEKSEKNG